MSHNFRDLVLAVVSETASIGRAKGVALPATVEEDTWSILLSLPGNVRASTAIDLENGRPLEIEWISGAARRLAKEFGIDAPINSTLYALLLPYRFGKQ
jgi:2-dehydropantoate 2-reductase